MPNRIVLKEVIVQVRDDLPEAWVSESFQPSPPALSSFFIRMCNSTIHKQQG